MGNASSIDASVVVYLDINGKHEKIVFSKHCSSRDIHDLVAQASGCSKYCVIQLRDSNGAHVSMAPTMPSNSPSTPYKVSVSQPSGHQGDSEVFTHLMAQVADQFNRAFKVEEMKSEIAARLTALERKMEIEGLKAVEIEKCKKDISEIKDQIWTAQKKFVDYNRMRTLVKKRENRAALKGKDKRPSKESVYIMVKCADPDEMSSSVAFMWVSTVCQSTYLQYTLSQETIDYLKQPTFDIWHWEPNEMLSLLEHMYHELDLVKEFNMNPITLKRWLLCVQENYRNNPFHNFRHCFCVTQMMYGMVHLCKLWDVMTKEEIGVLITASVCHDLDHPGYNNTYQINARTELAIRYNDISPLENHHCAVAFQILSNPETNIFSNVDKDTFKRIRAGMTQLILATDMARHSEIIESFKTKQESSFDYKNKESLDTLKMVLIKCCDISNEVRPMEVSEPWVDCLLEEYFNQSDREKMEGLPVAPFMDRDKVTKPTAQIGFIKFVLIPMFETMARLFPKIDNVMVEPLRMARDRYEGMKEQNPTPPNNEVKTAKNLHRDATVKRINVQQTSSTTNV